MCKMCSMKHCGFMSGVHYVLVLGGLLVGANGLLMLVGFGGSGPFYGRWGILQMAVYLVIGFSALISLVGCKCKTCMEGKKLCEAGGCDKCAGCMPTCSGHESEETGGKCDGCMMCKMGCTGHEGKDSGMV